MALSLLALLKKSFIAVALLVGLCSCDNIDNKRIPIDPVNIEFRTEAEWSIYGVTGALQYKYFIRDLRKPSNFPYTELTRTGFGGILLLCDINGEPVALDLACPVECQRTVRVQVEEDQEYLAICPKCGSKYDVFSLKGYPTAGPAAEKGYAMRVYHVGPGRDGSFMRVSY